MAEAPLTGRGLRAPFPYPGGKRMVAEVIWSRLGNVDHYLEPFAGSAAVLLARPESHRWWERAETIGDADCLVANFWRALQGDPAGVAAAADWPVNEADLHARHLWLVNAGRALAGRVMWDPDYYDIRAAGWWAWGACQWITSGWCETGVTTWTPSKVGVAYPTDHGVRRKMPAVADNGGKGVHAPTLHRYRPGPDGRPDACADAGVAIGQLLKQLAGRLRRVRVTCGDWARLLTPAVVHSATFPITGIFLDPPYSHEVRDAHLYGHEDPDVAARAAVWAVQAGDSRRLRIAFCCYDNEPSCQLLAEAGWTVHRWSSKGGHAIHGNGRGRTNRLRECIWFSPGCLTESSLQHSLF